MEVIQMKRFVLIPALFLLLALPSTALGESPSRVRELSCSDGTIFTGEQVRLGFKTPPRTWRNVEPGADPAAFTFLAADVTAPDGTIVELFTWDHSQGVDQHRDLITCHFIISVGELTGYTANFYGFFVPG